MIKRDPIYGCERWQGEKDRDGYGRIRGRVAHRVLWERENGPVPDGMELDHLCRRRDCVALHHLEPVTKSDNQRSRSWRRRAKRKCPNGCDMSVTAMVTPEGGRLCRRCER